MHPLRRTEHTLFNSNVLLIPIFSLAITYAILHLSPHSLFKYSIQEGRFKLYADRPITEEQRSALMDAARRIQACEFDDGHMPHEVFLCHDLWRYAFFAGPQYEALGITNPLGVSFVQADTARTLAGLIAHERTHALIIRRYGPWRRWFIPLWKEEGICEYVAGDLSYEPDEGMRLLRAGLREDSPAFRYFTYWLAVRQMVENEGLTLRNVIERTVSEAEAVRRAVEEMRK